MLLAGELASYPSAQGLLVRREQIAAHPAPVPSDAEGIDVAAGGVHAAGSAGAAYPPDSYGVCAAAGSGDGVDEAACVTACRARGLAVAPLRAYYAGTPRMTGLLLGFARTPAALATDTAKRLEVRVQIAS